MKHIVGFSGGIDSQACARWVLNRFPSDDVILINSNAGGNENPLTTEFVAEYSKMIHPVVPLIPLIRDIDDRPGVIERMNLEPDRELTFLLLTEIVGRFPSRKAQFCTQFLKNNPSRRWVTENVDCEVERYSGIRRDESLYRQNTPIREWSKFYDCTLNFPLADWTKQMCFDYVRAHKELINPLYSLGFERVGCSPCVNSSKEDIRTWSDRFPEMVEKIHSWEVKTLKTFFPPLLPGRGHPNWVHDVISWAHTDHGGYQFNILKSLSRPACESRFGLCE